IASSTGRGYLVIITASCQKLKNPFLDRPDYQPNRAPKRPNATVNKFRFLSGLVSELAVRFGVVGWAPLRSTPPYNSLRNGPLRPDRPGASGSPLARPG